MMNQFFKHHVDDVGHHMPAVCGGFCYMPQPGTSLIVQRTNIQVASQGSNQGGARRRSVELPKLLSSGRPIPRLSHNVLANHGRDIPDVDEVPKALKQLQVDKCCGAGNGT